MNSIKGKVTILRQRVHEQWLYRYGYRLMPRRQQRYVERLQGQGRPIKVVFVALNVAMWKYQRLYDLLRADERFEPTVVLSPGITYQQEQRLKDLGLMREYFQGQGVDYVDWKLEEGEEPVDIRRELNPDIVFYMQPYHGSYHDRHCFLRFTDRLIAYSPYSYLQAQVPYNYDNVMQNVAWKCYYVNEYHLEDARRMARNRGVNAVAAGYTSADDYRLNPQREVWHDEGHRRRRLIWAPHCTLANDGSAFSRSNFLMMADYMVELAKRHTDDLQIAFKPHPGLLTELYKHPEWGRQRADEYYQTWRTMPNTQAEEGTFIDLFRGSDAMVHDSGSFVIDYLYFDHPVMYVTQDIERAKSYVNMPGRRAYEAHYTGGTTEDVERFVNDVVLGGNDPMKRVREQYYQEFLEQPGGKTTAQNMYDDMVRSLHL